MSSITGRAVSRPVGRPEKSGDHRRPRLRSEVLGVLVVLCTGLAALVPALFHGSSLGSMDWASQFGLLQHPGLVVHNPQVSDQADLFIPWMSVAWHQVHQGHFPLWNPYNGWGMPLAFNWQSTVFSLPALVGYVMPLSLDYTVQVLVTLAVAGTGVYVLARTLRVGIVGSVFAGIVFELSGPFFGWLGWPIASVISWAGWLFAAVILVLRGERRLRSMIFLALVLAWAIYGGYPEALVLLALAIAIFAIVLLGARAVAEGWRALVRPIADLVVAGLTGVLLATPLLLPGSELASGSIRNFNYGGNATASPAIGSALSMHNLIHIVTQSFDGLPFAGSKWFGDPIYLFTAMYIGVIAVVIAFVGLRARWRNPAVSALALIAVISGGLVFFQPLVSIMHALPGAQGFRWYEASLTMDFAVAVLGGVGIDALLRDRNARAVRWGTVGFVAIAVALAGVWLFGRGHLHPRQAAIRSSSFIWPAVEIVVGLAALRTWHLASKARAAGRSRNLLVGSVAALMLCEGAFLVSAGAPLWSSSDHLYTETPAAVAFQRDVGSSLVGFGAPDCYLPPGYGIPQNVNAFFGVRELAAHDPITPVAYYSGWKKLVHGASVIPKSEPQFQTFCPGVDSVEAARLAGVSFILERATDPGPIGTTFVASLGDETLYRVPGVSAATLVPLGTGGRLPAPDAAGTPLSVTHPKPESWRLTESSPVPGLVRLRLSNVPGLHATVDGRPLALRPFLSMMLEARVPPGRHVVEVTYWPRSFTLGIALAGAALLAMVSVVACALVRGRRRVEGRQRRRPAAAR